MDRDYHNFLESDHKGATTINSKGEAAATTAMYQQQHHHHQTIKSSRSTGSR
jgi:hypothetical protein